jgi:peptidoglycan hydrolase-like protein with peptidoglycan-binding domain
MKRSAIIPALLCALALGGLAPTVASAGTLVFEAQEALKTLGYSPGPSDGEYGPRTEEAIRQFQRDNGLAVTGRLNDATVATLGRQSGRLRRGTVTRYRRSGRYYR